MLKLQSLKNSFIVGILLLINISMATAGIFPYNGPRIYTASPATPVTIGLPTATTTVEIPAPYISSLFKDVSVLDKITLGVDHSNMTFQPIPADIIVKLKLEQWDKNNTLTTSFPELTLKYQPFSKTIPYIDKATYNFTNAYKYKITIQNITSNNVALQTLQSNLFIDADIQLERYTDFSSASSQPILFTSVQAQDLDCDNVNDKLQVNWQTLAGVEEYQLEWTFVNDYGTTTGSFITPSATNLPYDFKNNSTRITTAASTYSITLTFEHGYLLYRVRGIGRDLTDPTKSIVGVWNINDKGAVASVSNKYFNQQEHEANKNWQYSATYAEEGKKKEVISYFDGSLRNRQSVTKINSDNNTIVGETIYDHQGRPAINVLPVPVAMPACSTSAMEPSIKYYPNFNKADGGTSEYTRTDFDLDASPADSCSATTKGMNVASGASNYYSPSNPKKNGAQGFVPDGKKYPFTQIEYTPDNTGRIRRQGGVGPDYQLGKQHETKYFYGWPNQVQLDRMFGSEVGDAAHYKKNLVIDANGQVSVSYLDQEGRTIATSLAGDAPKDALTHTTILEALASEGAAVKNLTIDLFAKDANGKSKVNTQNVQADAIVFNSQLLVAFQSDYEFNYNLTIDTLYDACLKNNICFNCVYNLEIKVTDDCGRTVIPLSGANSVKKTIGHFTSDVNGNVISFNTTCTSPTQLTNAETFKLNLPVGNYTVSKTLTINSDARDFYVKSYLDTINTTTEQGQYVNLQPSCVRSFQSFIDSAMAHLDTADCNISCATCRESLMKNYTTEEEARDAWVAAGNGSELDFDFLMEECGAPCKEISVCEATYEMLLMDVSPDGQYAQFQPNANGDAPDMSLSVFNTGNVLPKNVAGQSGQSAQLAHWRNPLVKINGTNYSYYLDENGTRSVIRLAPDGNNNFIPRVNNVSTTGVNIGVNFDATGNFYYTYPQNLTNIADFVANWQDSWAKSLVQYHPEYCYYESCVLYGQKQTGYNLTSDEFDALLQTTDSYSLAVANGLVMVPYTGATQNVVRFIQSGTSTALAPKDPFLFGTAFSPYSTQLQGRLTNFQEGNSMVELAAIAARCGTQYGTTIPANSPCRQFGKNTGADNATDTLDQEWNLFKNFYLSEKQKLQKQRDNTNAKACLGYNGCIGNNNYNPFTAGMVNYFTGFPNNYLNSPFFDFKQPCSVFYAPYYRKKKKRFSPDSNLAPPSAEETAYQVYQQTSQCPLAYNLQYLLTTMASLQKFAATAEPLKNHPEFTQDLYAAISGGIPAIFIPYTWAATTAETSNTLSVNINKTGGTACTIVLDKTGTGINSWNDVTSISQLKYTSTTGGNYQFTAVAAIASPSGSVAPYYYKTITGYSCINITGCNFQQQCKANDLANDLSNLWSALNNNRKLLANVNLNESTSNYRSFITPAIKNILGTASNSLIWNFNFSTSVFELYDSALSSKKLIIKFTSFSNGYSVYRLTNIRAFSDIKGNGSNLFTVNGLDANNNLLVTINGNVNLVQGSSTTPVSMGTCGLPDPILCQENEYKLRGDLEDLLKDVLLQKPFNPNADLTKSPKYTDLIKSYVSPSTQQSTSKYDKFNLNTNGDYKEQLYFNLLCQCKIILSHKATASLPLLFANLSELGQLTPYGDPGLDGNLYHFYMIAYYPTNAGSNTDTIFGESCLPIRICKPSTSPDTVVSPTVPYVNPCIIYQMNIAHVNAENAYKKYRDSLTTSIAGNYNRHCLGAFENFTTKYDDKEYHFTLYYYDQAGNLVRTIPPEGVSLVNEADTLQINQDRTFNRHTFFTDHTMATTYQYNSLNQLVRQNMPDHDLMDIWDYSLPNGLDSRLKITATQFVTSTKGYLSGYVDVNATTKRGYLYTTDDGGVTWIKMNDLVASDLKKIQLVDASNGFAVGNHGIVLKTTDGGNSWDMISLTGINVITTLNDLYFTSASNGIVIGDNGVVLKTVDAGLTFTSIAPAIVAGVRLNAITYDGTSLFVGGTDAGGQGKLYKGVVTNPTTGAFSITWSASTSVRSTDLVKVQMLGSTANGFAIGADGTLLRTSDGGDKWVTVATGLSSNFKRVYFKNTNEGVAILETVAGQGGIYKTTNAGVTWTLISAAGEYYNDFHFYQNDKGYAVGTNGKVKRLIMSGSYGLVNIVTAPAIPATTNLITVYFSDANNGWIAGDAGSTAYYTTNANSSAITWQAVSTGSITGIKKIYFGKTFNSGVLLTNAGELYRIRFVGNTYTFTPLTGNYVDIDDNATNVYGFDKTSRTVKYLPKADLLAPLATFGAALLPTEVANVVSINAPTINAVYIAGTGGRLFKGTATTRWTDNSSRIAPLAINDIQAAGTNTIYAVGNEGTLLQTTNGNDWKTLPTATIVPYNAIKFNTTATVAVPTNYAGLIAGNNGTLLSTSVAAGAVSLTSITLTTSDNLYDIALNTANKAYIAGANGTLVSIPNILTPFPALAVPKPAEDFLGISFKPSTNGVYTVGDNSVVYNYNNTSGGKIKAVFTPRLNDVNFVNVQNGYMVGDNGIIRHTADAGLSWQYILPVNSTGGSSIPTLNRVWTTQADKAVIIGNSGYTANIAPAPITAIQTVTYNTNISTGNNLLAIGVNNGNGYIVGANGAAYKTSNNGVSWSAIAGAPSSTLRAIHIFQDNTFIAVGNNSAVYTYNGATFTLKNADITAGTTLNDVFFHDDRNGYVVGNAGAIYKCTLTSNATTTAINWIARLLTGVNGVTTPTLVDITTIDFPSRYNGFIGGLFNTGITNANYARLLNDESYIFSTRFWYDRLGRMTISQNTKQYNRKNIVAQINRPDYSYTLYDALGRIKEVGELTENTTSNNFASIFGEYINGQLSPATINDAKLNTWINASGRREITRTYYDNTAITGLPITQENSRKRVASVTYEDVNDNNDQTYQHATHYSYDIHGNVKTVLQENKQISISNQRIKRIDYDYDLISGKVNLVRYQDGQPDAFYHFYSYDADNRITNVYTSRYPQATVLLNENTIADNPLWDKDAKYFYYAHGPLARVEIGDNKVQGMDYAYTLQGWIKGVNSNTLTSERDMGRDGLTASINGIIAKDAFGYSLNYHANDYNAIEGLRWNNAVDRFEAITPNSDLKNARFDLFNGNISSMVTTIEQPKVYTSAPNQTPTVLPQGTSYKYDQLNRLKEMKAYVNLNTSTNIWQSGSTYAGRYHNLFDYDGNGNILYQERADQNGVVFDKLNYKYKLDGNGKLAQNRLYHVNDANLNNALAIDDIDDQGTFNSNPLTINDGSTNNYKYDEIGNLSKDNQEQILRIDWTVYGKIKRIIRTSASTKSDLEFNYDASGNRISKIEKPHGSSIENGGANNPGLWTTTYYTRDAQGNIMTTYKLASPASSTSFKVIERNLFGSSRLGTDNSEVELISALPTANPFVRILGNKQYEMTNHLGNVLTTVSDRKIPMVSSTMVVISDDHFIFGTDGWSGCSPTSFVTNYLGGLGVYSTINLPIVQCVATKNILIEAGKNYQITLDIPFVTPGINDMAILVGTQELPLAPGPNTINFTAAATVNSIQLGLSGYIDYFPPAGIPLVGFLSMTIKVVTSTTKINYLADIISVSDYTPFGAPMNERSYRLVMKYDNASHTTSHLEFVNGNEPVANIKSENPKYRYGFNGQEKDDEVSGDGNEYDFGARIYNPRIGKFFSVDPRFRDYAWQTPYSYFKNSPIGTIDFNGEGGEDDKKEPDPQESSTVVHNFKYKGKDYTLTFDKKTPQEFELSREGGKAKKYDFYTTDPEANGGRKESMGLFIEQMTNIANGRLNKDYQKIANATFKGENVLKLIGAALTQNANLNIAIIGNQAISETPASTPEVPQYAYMGSARRGSYFEGSPSDFRGFTLQRAENVKNQVFVANGASKGQVVTLSRADVTGDKYKNVPVAPKNKDYTGATILFQTACSQGTRNTSCCFLKGTKILLANGKEKEIETLQVGDSILTVDSLTRELSSEVITKVIKVYRNELINVKFDNGTSVVCTRDHPFLTKEKGWSSFAPQMTIDNYKLNVNQLKAGDTCYEYKDGEMKEVKISSITDSEITEDFTYNLNSDGKNKTYIANGKVVHNETK